MKKLLIVSTSYPNSRNEAAGIFVQNFARALSNLPENHEVNVVAPSVADGYPIKQPVNVHFFRYAINRFETLAQLPGGIPAALKANPFMLLIVPLFLSGLFLSILKRSNNTDVVLAQWSLSGLIAGLAKRGKLLVTTFHGEDIRRAMGRGFGYLVALWTIKLSNHVVCVSEEHLENLKARFPAYSKKMVFISNGVDNGLYQIERSLTTASVVNGLMVNSLTANKSTEHMLDALEALDVSICNKLNITVAGDGPQRHLLETLVNQRNLADKVRFLGVLDQVDVFHLYEKSDFFLICSRGEGRSSVVMEAMASGLPVISSNVVGLRELLDKTPGGYLYNYGEIGQLAEIIGRVVMDNQLRLASGLENRKWARENGISWDKCAKEYLSLYA